MDDKQVKDESEEIENDLDSEDEHVITEAAEDAITESTDDSAEDTESEEKKTRGSGKNQDEIEKLKKQVEDLENQLKRAVADYRNLEKRFEEERRETIKFANRDLLLRLIPAFDTLFLAEKYVEDEGIKLTIRHLHDALKDVGVENVKTENQKFNAEFMEAVTTDEGEEGKVLEELRPGYTLYGKLVRPAQVKVGKGSSN